MQKGKISLLPIVGLSAAISSTAWAASPYVELYAKIWQLRNLEAEKEELVLRNEEKVLQRYRPLVAQGVITRQRFEEQQALVDTLRMQVESLRARGAESEALYELTRLKVENGFEVEVCPEGE